METTKIIVPVINETGIRCIGEWIEKYGNPDLPLRASGGPLVYLETWLADAEAAMDDCMFNGDSYIEPLTMSKYQSVDGMQHHLYVQHEWFEFREVEA